MSWKCFSPIPFCNVFSNVFWRTYCAPINPNYRNYCREFIMNGAFLWGIRFVFSIPITFQYSVFALAAIVHRCFVRGPGVLFHFFLKRNLKRFFQVFTLGLWSLNFCFRSLFHSIWEHCQTQNHGICVILLWLEFIIAFYDIIVYFKNWLYFLLTFVWIFLKSNKSLVLICNWANLDFDRFDSALLFRLFRIVSFRKNSISIFSLRNILIITDIALAESRQKAEGWRRLVKNAVKPCCGLYWSDQRMLFD